MRSAVKQLIEKVVERATGEDYLRALLGSCSFFPTFRNEHQAVRVMNRILREDSNCIDIGCHKGSMLEHMLRLAPKGHHIAIEPIPDLCAKLRDSYGNNGTVRVEQVALSDRSGLADFYLVNGKLSLSGFSPRMFSNNGTTTKKIQVVAARLDALVGSNEKVDLIKIDVEGAELEVLRGAIETIRRTRPAIIFEHHSKGSPYFDVTPEDLFDFIHTKLDLNVFLMADWLSGRGALTRTKFRREFEHGANCDFLAYSRHRNT